VEQSKYAFGQIDLPAAELHRLHRTLFDQYYFMAETLVRSNLLLPALDYCLKCSHMFNLLDSSGGIGVTERMAYILRVRTLAVSIAKSWAGEQGPGDSHSQENAPTAGPSAAHAATKTRSHEGQEERK
jgi:glycyl-tRNA synthetase alpha chain